LPAGKGEEAPVFVFNGNKTETEEYAIVRNKLGFEGMLVVDPLGQSGGLALLWQEANEVNIQNYSLRHISAIITTAESDSSWRLTGFYGHPDRAHREESWKLLIFYNISHHCLGCVLETLMRSLIL
jgi:hypothetical protein